jgi:hypothetical protein
MRCFHGASNHVKIRFFNPRGFIFVAAIFYVSFEARVYALEFAGTTASDVTSSEYSSKDLSLVTQIHATRLFTDYEHRGFFRIGLLPIPVAENVQIQIKSADCLTNATLGLHPWNQPSVGVRRLELRNLEIKLLGEKQPRLSAVTARVGQDGALELSTVSVFSATGQQTSIPKATLQVAGSSAGWLHWNFDGQPQDVFLFKPASDKTP